MTANPAQLFWPILQTRWAISTLAVLNTLVLLVAVGANPVRAVTYVDGPVQGTWTPAGSPYVATDTLIVLSGQELRIDPGVEVLFDGPRALMVYGQLCAAGAEGDSITFAPLVEETHWCGIRVLDADGESSLEYCRIRDSLAEGETLLTGTGGAILAQNSTLVVSHCSIRDCRASSFGYLDDGGGAICCIGGELTASDNHISGCNADAFCTGGGGAIWLRGTTAVILHNQILDCHAHGMGGGIAGFQSSVDISHNVISESGGFHYGGGIGLSEGCTGRIFNNLIVENVVPDLCGGGIYLDDSNVDVLSCTLAFNRAGLEGWGQGGGICTDGAVYSQICNCIVWGNLASDVYDQIYPTTLAIVDHCDVQGGYWGSGNIDADPLFAAGMGSGVLSRFYLSALASGQMADSPCIDMGDRSASAMGLDQFTTRTDLVADSGIVDLGFHHQVAGVTGTGELPPDAILLTSYPNPFNPRTHIRFELPREEHCRLGVYSLAGAEITELLNGEVTAGIHDVTWDGRDSKGREVPSGLYLFRLQAGDAVMSRATMLLR